MFQYFKIRLQVVDYSFASSRKRTTTYKQNEQDQIGKCRSDIHYLKHEKFSMEYNHKDYIERDINALFIIHIAQFIQLLRYEEF